MSWELFENLSKGAVVLALGLTMLRARHLHRRLSAVERRLDRGGEPRG